MITTFQKSVDMHNEPKQKNHALHDPSVRKSLEIAKKYSYKVEIIRVANGKAFLSVSKPFLRSPHPCHFTSVVRTAKYVEAAFEKCSP